jgi:hypothetical protein
MILRSVYENWAIEPISWKGDMPTNIDTFFLKKESNIGNNHKITRFKYLSPLNISQSCQPWSWLRHLKSMNNLRWMLHGLHAEFHICCFATAEVNYKGTDNTRIIL